MSWSSRGAVLGTITLLGIVSLQLTLAQPGKVRPPVGPDGRPILKAAPAPGEGDLHGITLPTVEDLKRRFREIGVLIKAEEWPTVIERLQAILDSTDDVFAHVEREGVDGKRSIHLVNAKAEARRLIGSLPKPGLDFYKVTMNPTAVEQLKLAKVEGDWQLLAQLMNRYLYTDSGVEATELLATHLLDRGQHATAALCFERLFERAGPNKLGPVTLFKAALAFQYTKDKRNQDLAWQHLAEKLNAGPLVLGNKPFTLDELKAFVARRQPLQRNAERNDCPLVFGDISRSAQGIGGTGFLEPRFKHETITEGGTRNWVNQAVTKLDGNKQPLLHAFSPLCVTLNNEDGKVPLMIYRSFWGLHARSVKPVGKLDPKTKKHEWEPGDLYWDAPSSWSLDKMLREPRHLGTVNQWLQHYVTSGVRAQILFENSVVGSLSSDNVRVYAIEDFQVPPIPQHQPGRPGVPGVGTPGGTIGAAMKTNRLQAIELDSGKLVWEVPAQPPTHPQGGAAPPAAPAVKDELEDSFFLGAPLPMNGKLYVLNEKEQELRLVTLDPATGKLLVKPQRLGDLRERITVEVSRRYHAAHLAYGEGILVCPTNAGGVLGVDLLTNSLLWAYGYRDRSAEPAVPVGQPVGGPPGMIFDPATGRWIPAPVQPVNWTTTPPVVSGGKVVFTAPDANAVHCINLRDGSRVWKNPRKEGDLYLAGVFADKALIVGKNYVRGINLADGTELPALETGTPSGVGVASKDVYYLPLTQAIKTREPGICLIDTNGWFVKANTRSRKKEVPGTLLFYEGEVLSQTLTHVSSYPQLDVELKNIDELLAKNDKDPEGLIRRGDLRLDKGELGGAIEDLRTALAHMTAKHTPDLKDKARAKLFESLTEYFVRDFDKAEKYIKEYEAMCSVSLDGLTGEALKTAQAEEKRRKGNFYCLLGRGKESQKKLREAFEAYMNFGTLGGNDTEMMSVVDDPGVKTSPRVWAQGRITAMVASATKEQLEPLERLVAERWVKVKDGDIDMLRGFVSTFGSISSLGREARLQLAEKLMLRESDDKAMVDAERHLSILRTQKDDPTMSGRAIEALARLMTRKNLMEDAAYFYRVLGREHAKTIIRDGKTGQDFFNDLATDKRFLPYLDEPTMSFSGKVKSNEFTETHTYAGNLFQLEQVGEPLPFFSVHARLAVRSDYNQLKLLNRDTGEEIWSFNLNDTNFQRLAQFNGRNPAVQPRFSFQSLGHLVLLQVGHKIFALDATNKKDPKLWEKSLTTSPGMPNIRPGYQLMVDPRDGSTQVIYHDGWMQRLGYTGTLSPVAVPLLMDGLLQGVDPITGQVLWVRSDMPKNSHIYSDETYIYTIEMSQDGSTTGATRVFRLHDGVTVQTKDFSELYRNRLKMYGRLMLTRDDDGRGLTLKLYDIVKGEDVWKGTYPPGSFALQPQCEDLAGAVEPSGKVTIVDLRTLKTMTLKESITDPKTNKVEKVREGIRPEHLQKIQNLYLLRDAHDIFIACDCQADQLVQPNSMQTNLMPGSGLRGLPVNGYLYSFDATTGEINWFNNAENQMLVLDEFERIPVVLLTSRYRKWTDMTRVQQQNVTALRSYDKKTGKLLWDKEDPNQGRYQQFHTVKVDARNGRVDLLSYNIRWSHFLESVGGGGAGGPMGRKGGEGTPGIEEVTVPGVPGVGPPGIAPPAPGLPPGFRGRVVPPGAPIQGVVPQIIEKRRIIRD